MKTAVYHSRKLLHKILEKKQLSNDVFYFKVDAPQIAKVRKAGQFIIFQLDEVYGERVPLTIADGCAEEGWIALVFQTVGATTFKLSRLNVGDCIPVLLGPLGTPTKIAKVDGDVVCAGGGIGVAPLYPIVKAHKAIGNHVTMIIGARDKSLILYEDEMRKVVDDLIIVTDNGSYGRKALITEPLKEICQRGGVAEVIAIGPPIMMKFCVATTREFNIPVTVSLNTIMIDGTGMCGGCRVSVGGEMKFVCVDGPEFDGYKVDFDNMMMRMGAFRDRERADDHKCRMLAEAEKLTAQKIGN